MISLYIKRSNLETGFVKTTPVADKFFLFLLPLVHFMVSCYRLRSIMPGGCHRKLQYKLRKINLKWGILYVLKELEYFFAFYVHAFCSVIFISLLLSARLHLSGLGVTHDFPSTAHWFVHRTVLGDFFFFFTYQEWWLVVFVKCSFI